MNILLLNLTRLGDLLEMQPVIAGLRAQQPANAGESRAGPHPRPDLRIGLVCLENFAAAARLLDGLDDIYPLPAAALLAGLDTGWTTAAAGITAFRDTVRAQFTPDVTLNLTPTLPARLLARVLAGPEGNVAGFGLDAMGFAVNANPWVAFTQAASSQRGCSPYNLTDQFRMIAGVGGDKGRNVLKRPAGGAEMSAMLDAHPALAGKEVRGFVGLQLGASEERRRWPIRHFAALAKDLWQQGYACALLGSPEEAQLGTRFAETADAPHVNRIGKTSLAELAGLLSRLRLLVTNDTGTMHLAAGLGTPILAFFLATAQPWDTGPYLEGACCLEPDMDCHPCAFGSPCGWNHACRAAISPALASELAGYFLEHGTWPLNAAGKGGRVWLSAFGQPEGFLDLVSMSGHESEDRTRWIRIQRHFYRQFLDRFAAPAAGPGQVPPTPAPIAPPDFAPGLSPGALALAEAELAESAQRLHLLYEQTALLQLRPSEQAKNRVIATLSRVQAGWNQSRLFAVLGHLWLSETERAEVNIESMRAHIADYRAFLETWREYLAIHHA